jgi:hypothetical protein
MHVFSKPTATRFQTQPNGDHETNAIPHFLGNGDLFVDG